MKQHSTITIVYDLEYCTGTLVIGAHTVDLLKCQKKKKKLPTVKT